MNIASVALEKLNPAPYNPRTISTEDMKNLEKSLATFGFVENIVANKDGTIIGGHQRYEAAKKLKLPTVPVFYVDLPKDKEKALNIALNRITGDFDMAKLPDLIAELPSDLRAITGFSEGEISGMLDAVKLEEVVEDEAPDPPKEAKTKTGDLYQLGEHRLLCGDATKIEDVEKLMGGQKADMVLTDPPYNTGMEGKDGSTWLSHMFKDSYSPEEWDSFLADTFGSFYAATKAEAAFYVCIDWRRVGDIRRHIEKIMPVSNVIVWDKMVHGLGSDYKYTYELIVVAKKGKPQIQNRFGKEYQDIWHVQRKVGRNEDHATAKPIALCAIPIRHASKRDDIVLDLFGGSGSTLIACEQTGRKCYMMEIDPRYCDVIVARWEKLTGKTATLLTNEAKA